MHIRGSFFRKEFAASAKMKYELKATFTLKALNCKKELRGQVTGRFEGCLATPVRVPQVGEAIPFKFNIVLPGRGPVPVEIDLTVTKVRHPHDGRTSFPEVHCEGDLTEITVGSEWDSTYNRAVATFNKCIVVDFAKQNFRFVSAERSVYPDFKAVQHNPDEQHRAHVGQDDKKG